MTLSLTDTVWKISPQSQVSAVYSLVGLAPSAKEPVPSLLRWATDGNAEVRSSAIEVLGKIRAEGDLVVPVLTNALHDPSAEAQYRALVALRKFGPEAHLAVPALVDFLNSLNPPTPFEVHRHTEALRALQAIDPEAAAKAGITNAP
jgi:HEAT repeat protein